MFLAKRYLPEIPCKTLPVRPYGLYFDLESEEVEDTVDIDEEFLRKNNIQVCSPKQIHYRGFIRGISASGVEISSEVEFYLPKPDKNGFFFVGSTLYVIANIGIANPWTPLENGSYYFLDKVAVAKKILVNLFGNKQLSIPGIDNKESSFSPLSNFFFNSTKDNILEVNTVSLQSVILSRLVTHPFVRQIEQTDPQINGTKDLVLLFPVRSGLSIDPLKFPEKLIRKLDFLSTSSSDGINQAYQLASGAKIVNGKIQEGTSKFCDFTRNNAVFLEYSPGRAYLARAAVMNSCKLTHPQGRPYSAPESVVDTRNLLTAIMDLGIHTYEDTIAMSESCALMFEGQAVQRITRWTPSPITEFKVAVGDIVEISTELASNIEASINENEIVPEEFLGDNKKTKSIVASELKDTSVLEGIQVSRAWYAGEKGYRTTFVFRSYMPMRTGDKISCFSGCKGIVSIVPDSEMPVVNGKTVDICVSPLSIFKRASISLTMEASIGKDYALNSRPTETAFADDCNVDFSWVMIHHGVKDPVTIRGVELPERVFWGYVPWFRIFKSGIASRRASFVSTGRPLTGEGLLPDRASVAGQSLDPSKSVVLLNRGMTNVLKSLLGTTPSGINVLAETIAAIEGPAHEYSHC